MCIEFYKIRGDIMIKRIEGTETTRTLIQNILARIQKDKPQMSHIDYKVKLEKKVTDTAELSTYENEGVLRNVSLIDINPLFPFSKNIKAAIGNKTGNILLEEKPFFMSTKKALKKIEQFLTNLQLKSRLGFKGLDKDVNDFGRPEQMKVIKLKEKYKNFDVTSTVDASNSRYSAEASDVYQAL